MKKTTLLIMVLGFILGACSQNVSPEKTLADEYQYLRKEAKMKLSKIESKMLQLEIKMKQKTQEARAEMQEEYQELLDEKAELEQEISEASEYSGKKWREFKDTIGSELNELESKVEDIIES